MSAPSVLAKNLRTVGQGIRICVHYAGQFWVSMIRSPYRRVCLGTIFTVLPLSAGIAAYNLSPSGAEEEARSRQVMIEVPLEIPAISEQIDVVTSHRPQATHHNDPPKRHAGRDFLPTERQRRRRDSVYPPTAPDASALQSQRGCLCPS